MQCLMTGGDMETNSSEDESDRRLPGQALMIDAISSVQAIAALECQKCHRKIVVDPTDTVCTTALTGCRHLRRSSCLKSNLIVETRPETNDTSVLSDRSK